MVVWRYALPLVVIAALLIFDDFIAVPSCVFSDTGASYGDVGTAKLKAMIVSDLLLNGSDAGFVDTIFRYNFISHFFRKSFEKLEPDILVVLGDIAAKTAKQGKSDWKEVMQQFYRVIGPMTGVPLVVGLGERDVGQCYELDEEYVGRMARDLPVLDHTGSASFMFENMSFLLMNSVALLCNDNSLRSGVEKLIESENFYLRAQLKESLLKSDVSDERNKHSYGFPTLKSSLPSGSGPVLLLHFPLSRAVERNCERSNVIVTSHGDRFTTRDGMVGDN